MNNQRIFVEVKYTEPYDGNVYTKLISITDYEMEELIERELKLQSKNAKVEDFKLFTMSEVAKVSDMIY